MEYELPCPRHPRQRVENDASCAAAVDGQRLPAGLSTELKHRLENCALDVKRFAVVPTSVEAHLANVARARQKSLEEFELVPPCCCELGVQS
jgi:hypothetical protein